MNRRHLISPLVAGLLFALLFSSLAWCAASLHDDPALSKPVTLAAKGEALSDVIKSLESQTGIHLMVSPEIADQKATIFVDAKPLNDIMAGLATLFQYEWSRSTSDGHEAYTISEPALVRKARDESYRKVVAAQWAKIETELTRDAQMKPDQVAAQAAIEALKSRIASNRDGAQQEYEKLSALHDDVSNALTGRIAFGKMYVSLSQKAIQALHSNCMVYYDSQSPEPEWKLSADLVQSLQSFLQLRKIMELAESDPKADLDVQFKPTDAIGVMLQAGEFPGSIETQAWFYPRYSKPSSNGFEINCVVDIDSADLKSAAPAAPTEQELPSRKDDTALDQRVTIGPSEYATEAHLPRQTGASSTIYANRSDVLALIHRQLGLQIISDYYSWWFNAIGVQSKDTCVKDVLTQLSSGIRSPIDPLSVMPARSDWGWDGQFIYSRGRDQAFWDRMEIPNRLLAPWRGVLKKQGCIDIGTEAAMACLSDDQDGGLSMSSAFLGLSNDDRGGGRGPAVGSSLRFYASLNAEQRKKALSAQVEAADLTSAQQAELLAMATAGSVDALLYEHDGIRVGIYDKNARRVDKPAFDAASNGKSVSFSVQAEPDDADTYYYCEDTKAVELILDPLDATAPDAALTEAKKGHPTATMASIARSRNVTWTFTIRRIGANDQNETVDLPGVLTMCGNPSATAAAK